MLTAIQSNSNLSMPLTHSGDGIEAPHLGQKRPLSTVVFLCPLKSNTGLIRILSFMVGCIEQPLKRLAVPLCGSFNLIQSTAQRLKPMSGGLYSNKGYKHMLTHTQNPLNISVSETKQQPLKKQHEIIGHALNIFCTEPSESTRSALKHDALELVHMLDDLSNDLPRTSRFNVLSRTKQLIAERVTFDQAKQYQDCIVKFAGMEVIA